MSTIIVPATYADQPDATLTVKPDCYGDSYTMTLAVAGRIIAQGEDFRPGAASDFGDGEAAAYTVETFGSFLAHAIESSDDDARNGWSVLTDDASDWVDALALYGEADDYPACPICGDPIDYCQGHGELSESDATAYLLRDGNLHVPCSRYGHDTTTCAHVAYRLANYIASEQGEPLTLDDVDYAMGLVVNDHDDVAALLGEEF